MTKVVDSESARLRDALLVLLRERFGIDGRPGWLVSRLERAISGLSERLGHAGRVLEHLEANPAELAELAERLRVGETRFFRDPEQWQLLAEKVVPALARSGRLRALSAGCSTGEEAWTLGMLLERASEVGRVRASVLGVDRSSVALEVARAGVYPAASARSLPRELRERYLVDDGDGVRVRPELFEVVTFLERELMGRPPLGRFSLIVCKNLIIYLEPSAGLALLRWLLSSLEDDGVLLVARSELRSARVAGGRVIELGKGVSVVRPA